MTPKIDRKFEQLLPRLTGDEQADLKASLVAHGCRDPLVAWKETGILLDGHERLRICEKLKLPFSTTEVSLPNRDAAAIWIVANQLARRNLPRDAASLLRGQLYERLKRRDGGHGDQRSGGQSGTANTAECLARRYGLSVRTIKRDAAFARHVEELRPTIPDVVDKIMQGTLQRSHVAREMKRLADAEARKIVPLPAKGHAEGEGWTLYGMDFREAADQIPDGSVTLIVTDPPYNEESLPMWADLSAFASRVLCSGGILLALSGKLSLPEVLNLLGQHVTYGWTYVLPMPASNTKHECRRIYEHWKPLLAYSKGNWPVGRVDFHSDLLPASAKCKDKYHWQQDPHPIVELIDRLAPKGSIVCDPMAGTASFGGLALRMGRRFVGCELDAGRFEVARKTLLAASGEEPGNSPEVVNPTGCPAAATQPEATDETRSGDHASRGQAQSVETSGK